MTTTHPSQPKPKITDATTTVVEALLPFDSNERKRIVTAALALVGETQISSSADSDTNLPAENVNQRLPAQIDSEFFVKFPHQKPSDNALLVAAYHYARHGSAAFSVEEMRNIAELEAGLTIPARLDMTYEAAQRDGKSLFARAGRGQFKPTVNGEQFFRDTYKVRKGNLAKTSADKRG